MTARDDGWTAGRPGVPEEPISQDVARQLRDALLPFVRVWLVNRDLRPTDDAPLAKYVAGGWPTMGDTRRAYLAHRAAGGRR